MHISHQWSDVDNFAELSKYFTKGRHDKGSAFSDKSNKIWKILAGKDIPNLDLSNKSLNFYTAGRKILTDIFFFPEP